MELWSSKFNLISCLHLGHFFPHLSAADLRHFLQKLQYSSRKEDNLEWYSNNFRTNNNSSACTLPLPCIHLCCKGPSSPLADIIFFGFSPQGFKTRLLERGLYTLIRDVSFSSPTEWDLTILNFQFYDFYTSSKLNKVIKVNDILATFQLLGINKHKFKRSETR